MQTLASSFFFAEIFVCFGVIFFGSIFLQVIGTRSYLSCRQRGVFRATLTFIAITSLPWLVFGVLGLLGLVEPFIEIFIWMGTGLANAILSLFVLAVMALAKAVAEGRRPPEV